MRWAIGKSPEPDFNPDEARYFLFVLRVVHPTPWRLREWRRRIFVALAGQEASRTAVFHLPPERAIVMGGEITLAD